MLQYRTYFLATQDALEVMGVTESLCEPITEWSLADLTDVMIRT